MKLFGWLFCWLWMVSEKAGGQVLTLGPFSVVS